MLTKPASATPIAMVQVAETVPPSPKQALVALIAGVAWHVDYLSSAAEDIETALDAVVDDAEIANAGVMAEIYEAVETVRSALDGGLNEVEQALRQLDALAATITDDDDDA
jgi:hypothetical protein